MDFESKKKDTRSRISYKVKAKNTNLDDKFHLFFLSSRLVHQK